MFRHAVRPKKPAGRMSSTIAMMTKITVFEASGKNTLVRPSTMPSVKPVRMAPMIEPMPPTGSKNFYESALHDYGGRLVLG